MTSQSITQVSFYKYLSVSSATAVLTNQTLRWATPQTFNDPADMQMDFGVSYDRDSVVERTLDLICARCAGTAPPAANAVGHVMDQFREYFQSRGEEFIRAEMRPGIEASLAKLAPSVARMSADLRKGLATTKVICFSVRRDSTLMWSHYAESHAGIVLEFRNAANRDSPYKIARPVMYSNRIPQFYDDETIARILAGDAKVEMDVVDRLIYTKSDDWAYEHEWRIDTGDGRLPNAPVEYVEFFTEELHAVYFGCRATDATRSALIPIISMKYPHAEIWQVRRATNTYALDFDRVS